MLNELIKRDELTEEENKMLEENFIEDDYLKIDYDYEIYYNCSDMADVAADYLDSFEMEPLEMGLEEYLDPEYVANPEKYDESGFCYFDFERYGEELSKRYKFYKINKDTYIQMI